MCIRKRNAASLKGIEEKRNKGLQNMLRQSKGKKQGQSYKKARSDLLMRKIAEAFQLFVNNNEASTK